MWTIQFAMLWNLTVMDSKKALSSMMSCASIQSTSMIVFKKHLCYSLFADGLEILTALPKDCWDIDGNGG